MKTDAAAARAPMTALLAWTRERASEMVSLLRDVVEIESPSTDPTAVAALAVRLSRELTTIGIETERVPVHGAGPILRAHTRPAERALEGPAATRPIMLLGHLDTVWPLGTLAARPVRIEGGLLMGPGCYDMKAGLVVAVWALKALAARGPLPPCTVFFTPLEEVDCEPYRALMETEMKACRAVLGFEPAWPGGAVKTSRKGSGSFLLRAHGRAAHAGADPQRGKNAVIELCRKALEISEMSMPDRGLTLNVGVIRGGIRPNVIPDLAELEVDLRYIDPADGHRAEAALRALRPRDPGISLELEGGLHYPPLFRGPHVIAVYEAAKAVAREMDLTLEEVSSGGASEASFAAALEVPTLDGLGADGDGAHAEDENVVLSSLPDRVALVTALVERLAGGWPLPSARS
jgi:glutamate carboxypeptidase